MTSFNDNGKALKKVKFCLRRRKERKKKNTSARQWETTQHPQQYLCFHYTPELTLEQVKNNVPLCVARSLDWCLVERKSEARTGPWCDIDGGDISAGMDLFPHTHMALLKAKRWHEQQLTTRRNEASQANAEWGSSLIIISLFIGKRRRACQSIRWKWEKKRSFMSESVGRSISPVVGRIYCSLIEVLTKTVSFMIYECEKRERSG